MQSQQGPYLRDMFKKDVICFFTLKISHKLVATQFGCKIGMQKNVMVNAFHSKHFLLLKKCNVGLLLSTCIR